MAKIEAAKAPAEAAYTKEQLAASSRYAARRDLVSVLLENGRTYTLAEVEELIDRFKKGEVK